MQGRLNSIRSLVIACIAAAVPCGSLAQTATGGAVSAATRPVAADSSARAPLDDAAQAAAAALVSGKDISATPTEVALRWSAMELQLQTLQSEREQLAEQITELEARRVVSGRAFTKLARAGLLPASGGLAGLVDHAARVERLRRLLERDTERQHAKMQRRSELDRQLGILRRQMPAADAKRQLLARAHAEMRAAQERAQAFDRAFLSAGPSTHTAVYGAGIGPADPADVASGFAGLKGRLPFPIPGRAEIETIQRPGAGGPGLEMRVRRGAPVRAVYAGRVAYADTYADYGRTVILDHGDGYFTVSANLGSVSVSAGDEVATGSRLGTAGNRGDGPLVYFEIREGAQVVDPAPWFGI